MNKIKNLASKFNKKIKYILAVMAFLIVLPAIVLGYWRGFEVIYDVTEISLSDDLQIISGNNVAQSGGTQDNTSNGKDVKSQDYKNNFEGKYEDRLKALNLQNETLDRAIDVGYFVALFLIFGGFAFAYMYGRRIDDIEDKAKKTAQDAIEDAIRKSNKDGHKLHNVILKVNAALKGLESIKSELSGYVTLAETARSADSDPLVEYHALADEIKEETKDKNPMSDKYFRQRSAVIFDRIIKIAKKSEKKWYL